MKQSDAYLIQLSKVVDALQDLATDFPIEDRGEDIKDLDLDGSLRYYFNLKHNYDLLDTLRKKVYARLDALNKHAIPELLEASGTGNKDGTRIRISNTEGRSFRVLPKYGAKVQDKEGMYDWLRKRGDGEMITETVNAGTLSAYLQRLLKDEGVEAPEEIVEMTSYTTVGMTKYQIKK